MAKTSNQIATLEQLASPENKKDPSKLTGEELFYELYKIKKSYNGIFCRTRNTILNGVVWGDMSREELEKQEIAASVIMERLQKYANPIYEEIAKRLGLNAEEKRRAINRAYAEEGL
jgi:hypothetical protein